MNDQVAAELLSKTRIKSHLKLVLMVCNIALSSFYFGYLNNYFSSLNIETMIKVYSIPLAPSTASGLINGIVPLSSIIGAMMSYHLITKMSRRNILLKANYLAFFAGVIIYVKIFPMLMIARILQGICVGCFSTMSPLIIRELAPTEMAGVLGSIPQIFLIMGVSFACFLRYFLAHYFNDPQCTVIWPYIFGFPLLTLTIQTISLLFIFPFETPKYLIGEGRQSEARELLAFIYNERYVQEVEMEKIEDLKARKKQQIDHLQQSNLNISKSIWKKMLENSSIIAIYIGFFQQFSGINPVSLYGSQIFRSSMSSLRDLVPTIINSIQLFGTLSSTYLLYHYGRKQLLVKGSLILALSAFAAAIGLMIQATSMILGTVLVFIALTCFSIAFGATIGPVSWLYISQVADPEIIPYVVAFNRISAFSTITFFPILSVQLFNNHTEVLFIYFGVVGIFTWRQNNLWLIQTRGKEEREIKKQLTEITFCH